MILQNIIFPKQDICQEIELYYHPIQGNISLQKNHLIMESNSKINLLTYFNSFSVTKWQKYTTIHEVGISLICKGKGTVSLCQATMQNDQLEKRELRIYPVDSANQTEISFFYENTTVPPDTVYYIEIETQEGLEIFGGNYSSDVLAESHPINIAIGICTYRREKFIQKTLQTLQESFLDHKDSILYGHLHIFVSDNGNTLSLSDWNTENIHTVYNRNAGGSGGFGRCMLEAIHAQDQYHFTHILLMDDDIILEPEILFRTFTFLSLLQEQYQDYLLAGALLRMDIPYIQHANGESWGKGRIGLTKAGYDLRQEYMLIKNEEDLPIEYSGWWYCCIPMNHTSDHFFPLPIFIHRDDIEYGLRYDGKLLTLNGIGVWHDAFDNRRSSNMEYYDIRNALICNAIHYPEIKTNTVVKYVCKHLLGLLLRYRYEDQHLTIRAVRDFCKGVAFLKTTDTVRLNQDISQMGYQQYDIREQLQQYKLPQYDTPPTADQLYLLGSFSRRQKITLNGWLLPAKKECKPVPFGAHPSELYRYKNILLYDPDTGKGFHVKRQHRQLLLSLGRCLQIWWLLHRHYHKVVRDYQAHGAELTTQDFWEQYLENETVH